MVKFDCGAERGRIDSAVKGGKLAKSKADTLRDVLKLVESGTLPSDSYIKTAEAIFALPVRAPSVGPLEALRKVAGWTPALEAEFVKAEKILDGIDAAVKDANVKVRPMVHTRDYGKDCPALGTKAKVKAEATAEATAPAPAKGAPVKGK